MQYPPWQQKLARAFGEYLSHAHPENRNGSDQLLSDTFIGQDSDSPSISRLQSNSLHPRACPTTLATPAADQPPSAKPQSAPPSSSKRRVSLERGGSAESGLQPARVYTITGERGMLGVRGSEESLELEVLKGGRDQAKAPPPAPPSADQQQQQQQPSSRSRHRGGHHHGQQNSAAQPRGPAPGQSQPLQSSGSAHNIRDWGSRRGGSREDCSPDCVRAPTQSQRSLDLDTSPRDSGKQRKKLERMYSEDRAPSGERDDNVNGWFPKENMFSFQTATTTMQAISAFRGIAERKRRKREQEAAAVMERNFRKHLRMVGSRRVKVQTFADRRAKSFSRSWSDPTPIKPDSLHNSRDSGDLQASSGTLDEVPCEDVDWEEERELERAACEGDDFIPPKIMLISSKVPKAEYVPTIIRRGDPSIIPILYDHEHATFNDILEEIEKKLTAYRKGCKIWRMLIFCQGGPGHLYLLKNKVATFAKVEKEEDMISFWKRLSRFMSALNPEPNVIHIMGCYVLGNANGEKLFQNLKNLMRPYSIEFKSPLELSAEGKEMIEIYFDFRLFRLWKARQHSKLLDYIDVL
ncbi:NMDA receptor synaptonuclear signaling and neuronal migration factor-like isoform X2 [Anguilla anguilla]|uniref:NMDA receptor synaptonuclear signaling and neuronal migration factor-like isoform X2 n=1 Tax=Anguilla anguilla TaxID=7936 RepID=UPI0015AB756A|nr:NMDA receptor synaptonuclear signaling and neuronal migration factor-like isoform X2 [Anguilla anguilla]